MLLDNADDACDERQESHNRKDDRRHLNLDMASRIMPLVAVTGYSADSHVSMPFFEIVRFKRRSPEPPPC